VLNENFPVGKSPQGSKKKEKAMPATRNVGKMSFDKLATADELGIPTGSITQMVEMYLDWAEAYAAYWIQMRNGVLLLQMIPGDPASGGIYLLDLATRTFYLVCFEGLDYLELTRSQFERLVKEYGLLRYASNPSLIHVPIAKPATA
jgi:hypothetical protein